MRKNFIIHAAVATALIGGIFPSMAGATPTKPKAPIEISADDLVLDQEKSLATFTGNVQAVQDKYTLKSTKMVVHYLPKQQQKTGNSISKIEVFGNVELVSPGEKALGDNGVYDVASSQLQLNGNVKLSKNNNMVQGSKLVYNLETGQSILSGGNATQKGEAGGRVKGVFVPEE